MNLHRLGRHRKVVATVGALTLAGVAFTAGIAASADTTSPVITACTAANVPLQLKTSGTCPKGTTTVQWNQQGPAGPQGPQGPAGTGGSGSNSLFTATASLTTVAVTCPGLRPDTNCNFVTVGQYTLPAGQLYSVSSSLTDDILDGGGGCVLGTTPTADFEHNFTALPGTDTPPAENFDPLIGSTQLGADQGTMVDARSAAQTLYIRCSDGAVPVGTVQHFQIGGTLYAIPYDVTNLPPITLTSG